MNKIVSLLSDSLSLPKHYSSPHKLIQYVLFCLLLLWTAWGMASTQPNAIEAHKKYSFQVIGLQGEVEKNVNIALKDQQNILNTQPSTADKMKKFYQKAPQVIRAAMQPFGYFHPKITATLQRNGQQQWMLTFSMIPGPPIRITAIHFNVWGPGKENPAFQKLSQNLPIRIGDPLNTQQYKKILQRLYEQSSMLGYFDAKILESKIYINRARLTCRIVIQFQTGPRYFFGPPTFSDPSRQNVFQLSFLKRFLQYKEGEPYRYDQLKKTQEGFVNSRQFLRAVVTPLPKQAVNYHVPVSVSVTPRRRYFYTLGLGYGSDTGVRATAAVNVRRVNQYGHQADLLAREASNHSTLMANYYIPGRNAATDLYTFTAATAALSQRTGSADNFKLQASYGTALGDWKQTISLIALRERYNLTGVPQTETELLFFPSINWQYMSARQGLHPDNGFNFSGNIAGTPITDTSNSGFFQARAEAKMLLPLFSSTRLLLRGSAAHTAIKDITKLPLSLQLVTGGARSIRGYGYNSLGPTRNLLTSSIELQQKIKGAWHLAVFFDWGHLSGSPLITQNVVAGVGPGIVWLSPVGMIELTVAKPIYPTSPGSDHWRIQFTMGPSL